MAIAVCPKCGAKNRVDPSKAQDTQPVCGKCGTKLSVPAATGASASAPAYAQSNGKPVEVTDQTFARDVLGAGRKPVILDAWAPWCGPCRMMAPVLDQLAAESNGRYVIAKINTDENPAIASQFRIDAIPTLLIFKDGKLVDRLVGLSPKQAIQQKIAAYVS